MADPTQHGRSRAIPASPGHGSWLRRLLIGLGVLAGLVVLVAGGLLVFLGTADWNRFRDEIAALSRDQLGREIRIEGNLKVNLLTLHPSLSAENVTIANEPWGSRPDMAHIRRIDFTLALMPLLHRKIDISGLKLIGPDILLEQNAKGENNWTFGPKEEKPQRRETLPALTDITVEDGKLAYRSPKLKAPIDVAVKSFTASSQADGIALRGEGRYEGVPFRTEGRVGTIAQLRDPDHPYPVKLDGRIGDIATSIDGVVYQPQHFSGFETNLTAKGQDLDQLYKLFGMPAPNSPPYSLTGHLASRGKVWDLTGFTARLGQSDLSGDIHADLGGDRPQIRADVASQALSLADLQGLIGKARPGTPEARAEAASGPVLPDKPFNLDKLNKVDADIRLKVKDIVTADRLLGGIDTHLTLKDGHLRLDPLKLGVAQGQISGMLAMNAAQKIPEVRSELQFRNLDLHVLTKNIDPQQATIGRIGGRAKLTSRGNSVHDLAANADGEAVLYMGRGGIGTVILELLGLDFAKAFIAWVGNEGPTPINCVILPFDVKSGLMTTEHSMMDTTTSTVIMKGRISFDSEKLTVTFTPYPKDFSIFNAPSVLTIEGDLRNRKVSTHPLQIVAQTALKLLLAPLSPFFEEADDSARACAPVFRQPGASNSPPARR